MNRSALPISRKSYCGLMEKPENLLSVIASGRPNQLSRSREVPGKGPGGGVMAVDHHFAAVKANMIGRGALFSCRSTRLTIHVPPVEPCAALSAPMHIRFSN
ncbi:hypothetical protein ACWGTI_27605 [Mesorhizobium sp. ArgA1]